MAKLKDKEVKQKLKEGNDKKNPLKTPSCYEKNAYKSAFEILHKLRKLKRTREV